MNIIKKIFNRLKAECIWAKMGFYTRFVYYHRKPLLVYKLTNMGGDKYRNFVIWQLFLSIIQRLLSIRFGHSIDSSNFHFGIRYLITRQRKWYQKKSLLFAKSMKLDM